MARKPTRIKKIQHQEGVNTLESYTLEMGNLLIQDVIDELQKLKDEGFDRLKLYDNTFGGYGAAFSIYAITPIREETDEELAERIKLWEEDERQKKERAKQRRKENEEREKREYARLKKKYEKKNKS